MNFLDKDSLNWVSRNKYTYLMVVLIAANVYQYIANQQGSAQYRELMKESIQYERDRSTRLESLLEDLVRLNNKQ
jgi:hypothetical protein